MDRYQEYQALAGRLEALPPALEYTEQRVRARIAARRRWARLIGLPAGTVAALFLMFVVLVNASTTTAYAMGRIPGLAGLAARVALSPSLSAAVENKYVQPMELSARDDRGNRVTVEYVIVDRKQVNIFFTASGRVTGEIEHTPATDNCVSSLTSPREDSALYKLTLDYLDSDVPAMLDLTFLAGDEKLPTLQMAFDPYFTQQGRVVVLDQWIELGGQRILIKDVEIYPTHVRVRLEDDPANTMWLHSLELTLADSLGNRVAAVKNGISASGSATPFMAVHMLESVYFSGGKDFTLAITGAGWLEKDKERLAISTKTGQADFLPRGVRSISVQQTAPGLEVCARAELAGQGMRQIFYSLCFDPLGNEYNIDQWRSVMVEGDEALFEESFTVEGFEGEYILLQPIETAYTSLDRPIQIDLPRQ